MSWAQDAKNALSLSHIALTGFELIEEIVGKALGASTTDALGALRDIAAIISSIRSGYEDKVSAADVAKAIAAFKDKLAENDEAADNALDQKFDS